MEPKLDARQLALSDNGSIPWKLGLGRQETGSSPNSHQRLNGLKGNHCCGRRYHHRPTMGEPGTGCKRGPSVAIPYRPECWKTCSAL